MLLELKAGMTPFLTCFQCALLVLAVKRTVMPSVRQHLQHSSDRVMHAATCSSASSG